MQYDSQFNMAERAASALKLGNDSELFKPKGFSFLGAIKKILESAPSAESTQRNKAVLERAAAEIILRNRAVRPVAGSRMVDILYSDPEPARAQKIAMGLTLFIAANLDKRFQANAYAKTFLEDQIKQLKLRLEKVPSGCCSTLHKASRSW